VALKDLQKKRGELSLCPDFRLIFERCNYSVSSDTLRIRGVVFTFNKKTIRESRKLTGDSGPR
jgi:hypothetical protein